MEQLSTTNTLMKPSSTVYMIGNIKEGNLKNINAAYCKWEIICDENNWMIENGTQNGQTWIAETSNNNKCVWAHPFDLEFKCKSIYNSPKLYLELYDSNKTIDFC